LQKGDILNWSNNHVMIYYSSTGTGDNDRVRVYESCGAPVHKVRYKDDYTWLDLSNYTPRRWNELRATTTWGGIKALYAAAPRNAAVELQWDPAPGANGFFDLKPATLRPRSLAKNRLTKFHHSIRL